VVARRGGAAMAFWFARSGSICSEDELMVVRGAEEVARSVVARVNDEEDGVRGADSGEKSRC